MNYEDYTWMLFISIFVAVAVLWLFKPRRRRNKLLQRPDRKTERPHYNAWRDFK